MTQTSLPKAETPEETESLFERYPWLYAFCRDHLFRDDTQKMSNALFPAGLSPEGGDLLELGCGHGFYARRLAGTFDRLRVVGVDRAKQLLDRADRLTATSGLENCSFINADARALPMADDSFDAVVVSRLFTILPEHAQVLAEMHRILKPGGRCFIAEPRSALRAAVPLRAMQALAGLALLRGHPWAYREPARISVLDTGGFRTLVESQPWNVARRWQDIWYQYAVCEKGPQQPGEETERPGA